MDDLSRRSLFTIIAASAITPAFAQHVHEAVAKEKSLSGGAAYKPLHFSQHYFATLRQLADLIIPADEHSGGASEGGAAEFIDMFCSRNPELAATIDGGLTWLDQTMHQRYSSDFLTAKPDQQTALLDAIAYTANVTPETAYGTQFWTLLRNMVVDAFYTSPAGVKDLGYMGNKAVAKFEVPQEAVDYVMKRSPLA